VLRGHEAAPIVVGDTMYIVTPYPNLLHALDLRTRAPRSGRYEPKPLPSSQGVACCDVVNRGAAYFDGKIIFNTLDNQTSPSMRKPARRSGARSSATSTAARR
jgi:lanthanide-dependent methanol dehydrogenase